MNKIWNKLGTAGKVAFVFITLLLVTRVFLPAGTKYTINWYLDKKLTTYQGRIEDFDLTLYRGAYQIQEIKIWKRTASEKNPFFSVGQLDLSLAWRGLLQGKLLGDLTVNGMRLAFLDSETKEKKETGEGEDWKSVVGELIPIELESLKIRESSVHFVNRDLKVPLDVVLDQITLDATNIKNTEESFEILPSALEFSARFQKAAPVKGQARMNLLAKLPVFEAKVQMEKLDITTLNDFFIAYGPVSFTKGKLSIFAEVGTKNNRIVGYVKPFFEELDVISDHEHLESPKRFFNEVSLALGNLILRNRKEKTVATKIEFAGASMSPDIDKWGALWTSLRNGFIEALQRSLENTISIKDVPAADPKK